MVAVGVFHPGSREPLTGHETLEIELALFAGVSFEATDTTLKCNCAVRLLCDRLRILLKRSERKKLTEP